MLWTPVFTGETITGDFLHFPFYEGDTISPFGKGRLGGILQTYFPIHSH